MGTFILWICVRCGVVLLHVGQPLQVWWHLTGGRGPCSHRWDKRWCNPKHKTHRFDSFRFRFEASRQWHMGMAHRRSIGAVRNKRIAPRFSTASSRKTRPHQGQHPRPQRLQVCTPWTPRNSLGVLGAAAVQQSGAEGFDQKTRTASSHQWKAELQSFQKALIGDKSRCLKSAPFWNLWLLDSFNKQSPGMWTNRVGHFYPCQSGIAKELAKSCCISLFVIKYIFQWHQTSGHGSASCRQFFFSPRTFFLA